MSRNQRLGLLTAAAVVVVVGFVIALSSGESSSPPGGAHTVTVVAGKPQGGVAKLTYRKGQTVDLTVKSDTADEIHIHGYDLHKEVAKGAGVHFTFPASTEGRFVIELEHAGQQIAELSVTP